jgi:phage terminase small subunit
MPAHRKPLSAHELSGAVAKNPKRFANRRNEPQPSAPVGAPPKHLIPAEKQVWREVVQVSPRGVLTSADRLLLEVASRLVVQFRSGLLMRASEISTLLNALGRLGLSPADRAKLHVQPEPSKPTEDPYSFLAIQ